VEKYDGAREATYENIIRRMRLASWVTKAANTHSEYLIFTDFPQHGWSHDRASVLSTTYIGSVVPHVRNYFEQYIVETSLVEGYYCNFQIRTFTALGNHLWGYLDKNCGNR
jgi:hypothetical protein